MKIDIRNKGLKGVFDIEQHCKDINVNIEKVTNLYCYSNDLTELKGLDKLVNLEVLSCYNNQLTELDLSKLVKLERLSCFNNDLTELKGLDKLVNLEWLYCSNNDLIELKGLDKLVNLEWLYCSINQLTELKDLDKLVNLKWLNDEKYTQPDRITMIIDKIKKMEKDIAEMKEIIGK